MENEVLLIAVGGALLSLALGLIDYGVFGGTVSPLSPAAAVASVAAFIAIVLLEEDSSNFHKKVAEGLTIAALALDVLHVLSLALGIPVKAYATQVLYFFFGFLELKKIKVFALKPFKIRPHPFTAKSLAIDPAPIMFVGYYLTWGRERLKRVLRRGSHKKGNKKD